MESVVAGHLDYGLVLGLELFLFIVAYTSEANAALNFGSLKILHLFLFQRGDGLF